MSIHGPHDPLGEATDDARRPGRPPLNRELRRMMVLALIGLLSVCVLVAAIAVIAILSSKKSRLIKRGWSYGSPVAEAQPLVPARLVACVRLRRPDLAQMPERPWRPSAAGS